MSLLRPLRDTTSTSATLARERLERQGLRRTLVNWATQAAVLVVASWVVPGIEVDGPLVALAAALVIGLLNALVRPILVLLTLPLTVVSVGLLSLLINAVMLVIAAPLVPGLTVDSLAAAVAAAIVITVLTTTVSTILSSNQDETFYAELTRRLAVANRQSVPGARGLVIVQIDGLAAPILRNAIRVGLTPTMARWVRSGTHRLIEWACVPPSQTSASQAGILHGRNDDIPAFRWYEKERGQMMVSNRPADAAEIEHRMSDGRGLLAANGMSAGNLFSGDARRTLFTMSRIQRPETVADIDAFSLYFVDPAAFIRTLVLTITEAAKEWSEARRQVALDLQPRVHRGRNFAVLRSISNVLLRDLNVTFLVNAIGRGTPIMYADFVDYDEMAHHAGPERLESLRSLAGVDRVLATIERASAHAPRGYSIVVLSDHGQSQGATFLQRYDTTLENLVRRLMGGDGAGAGRAGVPSFGAAGEGWGPVNALLAELRNRPGVAGRVATRALGRRGQVGSQGEPDDAAPATTATGPADVVVAASGNLANIYFPGEARRLMLEEIQASHPGLIEGLVAHPGIGFVLVRSDTLGALALGRDGVNQLDRGRIDGRDPLAVFGPRTAEDLRRLDGFAHVGDLVVNSAYDVELEEVAAFEELVGSHGGFGGPQVRPFILAPADLAFDGQAVVGAPAVNRLLVGWADDLGVGPTSGAADAPEVAAGPAQRARGILPLALLTGATSVVALLAGLLVLVGAGGAGELGFAGVGFVIAALGAVGTVVAVGLARRKGWARMAALVYYAIGVIQVLATVGSEGFRGLVSAGLGTVVITLLVFFYLTRPHVAAAFRARPRPADDESDRGAANR